ncbi:VOC family protein [Arthrobacter sp. H16F315]|uniref:VOC family protein n=1 Tax=Arthrobacter sp. H16F315 TaxID=2955314 RepID=UPI00209866AB|nr:VOC family protein [Arthrobacter sp. H16F315]MDD1476439.1 VOC family protein [Arthrobacter sp. H16F315]
MTTHTEYTDGEICRTDLQSSDVESAKAFYAAVFGWHYNDLPAPDGRSCAQAFLGDDLVAVIAPQNPQQRSAGVPGQWNVHFASSDAGDLAAGLVHAGGNLEFGPEPVGGTGVLVLFAPPGGGTTGAWQAGSHIGAALSGEPGSLVWAELLTPEPQTAVGFFQQLFGHDVTEYPQDDGGRYTTLMVNGAEVAGVAGVPADAVGTLKPGWQVYFGVSSVAEAVAAAVAAGGTVLIEPDEVEEAGTIATLADPQGGVFSVLEV